MESTRPTRVPRRRPVPVRPALDPLHGLRVHERGPSLPPARRRDRRASPLHASPSRTRPSRRARRASRTRRSCASPGCSGSWPRTPSWPTALAARDHARRARRVPRRAAAPLARPQDAHAAHLALMPFSSFGLDPLLLRGIRELGFTRPTPIQEQSIPPALEGRDVLACAATGSGKTAAFGLPILHRLMGKPRRTTRALILTPTRELVRADRRAPPGAGRAHAGHERRRLRRRRHGPAGARAARRRRRDRGDARAPARPLPPALRGAQGARDPRARRGRPHARHGLPARHQARAAAPARRSGRRCSSPPPCRRRSWRSAREHAARPGDDQPRPAVGARGRDHPGGLPGGREAQGGRCCSRCCAAAT